MEYIMNKGLLR